MIWNSYSREAEFALRAVRRAAGMCRAIQHEAGRSPQRKEDASPVTEADFASQALIAGWLSEEFPREALMAEEDSRALSQDPTLLEWVVQRLWAVRADASAARVLAWLDHRVPTGDRWWALDPIDGTKGFLRGGQYVVALALLEEGRVVVAALAAPALGTDLAPQASGHGCAVIAVRGEGAWIEPMHGGRLHRLAVSAVQASAQARLVCSFEDDHTHPDHMRRIVDHLQLAAPLRMDSQAKCLVVAGGQADLLIRLVPQVQPSYKEKLWDVAPGTLIVEEAGGRVTDLDGRPLDLTAGRELTRNRGSLISNAQLHEAALAAIQSVQSEASA